MSHVLPTLTNSHDEVFPSECIDVKQLDITNTLTANNFIRYITATKQRDLLILSAIPTPLSKPLFTLFGSPSRIWIYQGEVFPGPDKNEVDVVII